jgi:hypothetical protein
MLFYSNLTLFWSIVLQDRALTQTMDQNDEFLAKIFFSLKMILTNPLFLVMGENIKNGRRYLNLESK